MSLTSDQIEDLRKNFLRDLADAPTTTYLSHYNKATHSNWISDADLAEIDTIVEDEYGEELDALERLKRAERLEYNDSSADATAHAARSREVALFRLIRAEVRTRQLADPIFLGYLPEALGVELVRQWRSEIKSDRTFTSRRAGALGTATLVRE